MIDGVMKYAQYNMQLKKKRQQTTKHMAADGSSAGYTSNSFI